MRLRAGCDNLIWLAIVLATALHVHAQVSHEDTSAVDQNDINLGFPDAPADVTAGLLAQLGDPAFATREAAAEALAQLGPGAFRAMARAYRESGDFETRVRIEEIVREQYLWHALLKQHGFLGIAYPITTYHTLPDGTLAVTINSVEPDSAAQAAGLRKDDRIIALDGEGFADDSDPNAFKERVQSRGAGGKLAITVLREEGSVTIEVTLQARPIKQYTQPEMLEELNGTLQAFAAWRGRYFTPPTTKRERAPSTTILELPE